MAFRQRKRTEMQSAKGSSAMCKRMEPGTPENPWFHEVSAPAFRLRKEWSRGGKSFRQQTTIEAMKRNHRLNLLAALVFGALGSCSYYETQTTATPDYYSSGQVITTLPSGYRTVTVGGTQYYSYGDSYYRPHGSGYVVVDSPYATTTGSVNVIRTLPSGYRVVTHHGQRYYQSGTSYYQARSGGYVVVPSPF